MRRISMRKISELLRMRFELKLSNREIGRSLGISGSTVSEYLSRARAAGLAAWPLPVEHTEDELYEKLFLPTTGEGKKVRVMPDWEYVGRELHKKGVTLLLLWREYRQVHTHGLGYTQFCVHHCKYQRQISPVMRQHHKAGEKTFVDYAGMTVPWLDINTGELREAQIFVGCLGASQYTFVHASTSQNIQDWVEAHIYMWEYFGGVSHIVVPDNLKSGVTKAHRYDPDINSNYQQLGNHYGFAIVPARVRSPKDKGKVENAVGCVERQILAVLRHQTFTSLGEMNKAIQPLLEKFNNQKFQKIETTRRALFETLDKPELKPLVERYAYAEWAQVKVNIDYHIAFDKNFYSVPYQYIHQKIDLRVTSKSIECYHKNKRIAVHGRCYAMHKYNTNTEHMPVAHQEYGQWTPERIKNWANKIGPHAHQFIEHMISSRPHPEQSYRACLGVLRLAKSYGEARLERACIIGLEVGATRYNQIASILKNNMDALPETQEIQAPILPQHDNIRGSEYYQ